VDEVREVVVFDDQRRTKTTENHPWTCWLIHSLGLWVSGLTRVSVPCGRIQMSVLQAGRFIRFDNGNSGFPWLFLCGNWRPVESTPMAHWPFFGTCSGTLCCDLRRRMMKASACR